MAVTAEHWWKHGVLYQIYPRSFSDSNGDGIGDLTGIISKLDYLADLGIDGIWIGPIYPSPDVDFGYDVSDYLSIDPKFGGMQDLGRLIEEAHKRGIHILLDLVLNHTSEQHPWFQAARMSREDPLHDHYIWVEPKHVNRRINNWRSVFGGSAWEPVAELGQCYYHMFYKQQPDVNWRNPKVKEYMLAVIRFWLDKGVDGFRLDVFNVYFKDARLRNNPGSSLLSMLSENRLTYDCDQPELIPLLREIRSIIDERPGRYVIGEIFSSSRHKAAFYTRQGLLNGVLDANDAEILARPWRASSFFKQAQDIERLFEDSAWPTWFFSNHDMRRVATRYARRGDDARLKVVATMLLTLRCTPIIYYGDEIGMRDVPLRRSELKDGLSRRFYPFHVRDGARSPMQWNGNPNAGFSAAEPWMKVHPQYPGRNVESQQKEAGSLFNFYKRLIEQRREHPALQDGLFLPLTHDPLYVLAYIRKNKLETVLVILNFSHRKMRFLYGPEIADSRWELLIGSHRQAVPEMTHGYLQLEPDETLVLACRE